MARSFALALLTVPCVARVLPTTVEIAPDVHMPLINLGGVSAMPSNYTMWFEVGGHGVDTALIYGDDVERDVGSAVKLSGVQRSDLFVTTKIPCGKYEWMGKSSGDPNQDIDRVFASLGLEYVDLILLHCPCRKGGPGMILSGDHREMEVENTWHAYRALETLLKQGKTRAIGISNFHADDLLRFLPGVNVKPAVNQCEFSIGNHDDDAIALCKEHGVTYAAYSPLGGLNGLDVLHHPDVEAVAEAHGRSTAEIALRWVTQQGVVAVTASSQESHQKSDLSIFNFELSETEMQRLAAVGPNPQAHGQPLSVASGLLFAGVASMMSMVGMLVLKLPKAQRDSGDLREPLHYLA